MWSPIIGNIMNNQDLYTKLIALLDENKAQYRLIDHEPEGRTDIVSPMRGHPVSQAAKCMIVMLKIGKKISKWVLAVVPGDSQVDLNVIKALFRATYVSFASQDKAEALAGSEMGTVLPFPFHPDLLLIVDPELLKNENIYFNAARLDRSLELKTTDYIRIASPRLERIAKRGM
jgi:Ala-tRNA(Pro) deacylase